MQYTFEQIEDLKRQYTDKFVLVDASRPELRRFDGETGRVKTVNMSGRALVQFDMENNIGWFDIGLDYLHVVDGPVLKPAEPAKAGHDRASAPAKVKPDSPAATAGGIKVPEPGPAKKSTADVLAAARAAKGAGAAPAAKAAAGKAPAGKAPAAAKPPAAGAKLSTAEILAAARAAKEHAAEEQPAPVAEASEAEAEVEELEAEAAAEVMQQPAPPAAKAPPAPAGSLPKSTAEIIAWCRQRDAK
jgi:hypothetical protein